MVSCTRAGTVGLGLHALFNLIASHALCQHRDLLIGSFNFLLVVLILILEHKHFLEALILHFLIVNEQILQLLVKIRALTLPCFLLLDHFTLLFIVFFLTDALLGFQLPEVSLQI